MVSISFVITNLPSLLALYKAPLIYNCEVFMGALTGSYTLRKILNLTLITLETHNAISNRHAYWLKTYLDFKALLTPFIFVLISVTGHVYNPVKIEKAMITDILVSNFNSATGLLSPERHIFHLLVRTYKLHHL